MDDLQPGNRRSMPYPVHAENKALVKTFRCFLAYAQYVYQLTGASPERALIVGIAQPKAKESIARWNLKEAGGKHLA